MSLPSFWGFSIFLAMLGHTLARPASRRLQYFVLRQSAASVSRLALAAWYVHMYGTLLEPQILYIK